MSLEQSGSKVANPEGPSRVPLAGEGLVRQDG